MSPTETPPPAKKTAPTTTKTVTLKSSDKKLFEVDVAVAEESLTIKAFLDEKEGGRIEDGAVIPLPNVDAWTLKEVIEYCKKNVEIGERKDSMRLWGYGFMVDNQDKIFDLIMAANYLNIPGLFDLTLHELAKKIEGKTPEEIRTMFRIKNDFTPEEEAAVMKENEWPFG